MLAGTALYAGKAQLGGATYKAGGAMITAGASLHRLSTGSDLELSAANCECADCDTPQGLAQLSSGGKGTSGGASSSSAKSQHSKSPRGALAGSPSSAPTSVDYWEVFFTDGKIDDDTEEGDSYVWYMTSETAGITATVLVDTTGRAEGVAIDKNLTTVFFTDAGGAVYKVDRDGEEARELLSYTGAPRGLEYYEDGEQLFWVDGETESVYSCDINGENFETLVTGQVDPVGISIDTRNNHMYWSTGCEETNYEEGCHQIMKATLTGDDAVVFLSASGTDYQPNDLDISIDSREIYFAGTTGIYSISLIDSSVTTIHSDIEQPYGISVDYGQDRLFYTHAKGVTVSGTNAGSDQTLIAFIYDTHFIVSAAEVSPTASPSQVPSPVPSPAPSQAPSGVPIPAPSALPTPVPSQKPSPAPSQAPSEVPSPVPSQRPSGIPIPDPTPMPTPVPSQRPTGIPIPDPTPMPTPVPSQRPTGIPIPAPSPMPTPVPSQQPSGIPIPAPTSVCDYYLVQCEYCACPPPSPMPSTAAAEVVEATHMKGSVAGPH